MNHLTILMLTVCLALTACCSDNTSNDSDVCPIQREIFKYVEDMPQFPGGEKALDEFIQNNLVYPARAKELGIQGEVYVQLVVVEDGTLSCAKVVKQLNIDCDLEALRVVGLMPKFIPGKHNNREVPVSYVIKFSFIL